MASAGLKLTTGVLQAWKWTSVDCAA